jgi:hypothetical protein
MTFDASSVLVAVLFSTLLVASVLAVRWVFCVWVFRVRDAHERDNRVGVSSIDAQPLQLRLQIVRSDYAVALPESPNTPAHEELLVKARAAIARCRFFQTCPLEMNNNS